MKFSFFRLFADLFLNWIKRVSPRVGFWTSLLLVAVPFSFIVQLTAINHTYTTPEFAGIKNTESYRQLTYSQEGFSKVLPQFLSSEIAKSFPYVVTYTTPKFIPLNDDNTEIARIELFSGGYSILGIRPFLGSLEHMEFPAEGEQISVAITYDFWQKKYAGAPVINTTIRLSDKVATIVAVMPKSFESFFRGANADVVAPYAFLEKLQLGSFEKPDPSSLSYLLSQDREFSKNTQLEIVNHLKESVLLFEDETISASAAFGMTQEQHTRIFQRLSILNLIFYTLMIFSLISFFTYMASDSEQRNNEVTLFKLLGARRTDLKMINAIEVAGPVSLVFLLSLVLAPLAARCVTLFIPDVDSVQSLWTYQSFTSFLIFLFIVGLIVVLPNMLQSVFLKSTLGRGVTSSKGQKIQTSILVNLLLCVSCISSTYTVILIKEQLANQNFERGYAAKNRYIVTFSPPKLGGTFNADDTTQLLVTELHNLDDIKGIAITTAPMFSDSLGYSDFYTVSGLPVSGRNVPTVITNRVSPNYFDVAGIELVEGHSVSWERATDIVISKSLWDRHFENQSLSNAKFVSLATSGRKIEHRIVGVAENTHLSDADAPSRPKVYKLANVITGFESFIIETDKSGNTTKLERQLAERVKPFTHLLQNAKAYSLEEAIEKSDAPQKSMLATSIFVSTILLISTVIYIYTGMKLTLEKASREIALQFSVGASLTILCTRELMGVLALGFISLLLIGLCFTYAAFIPDLALNKTQATLIAITIFFSLCVYLFAISVRHIKQIKDKSWLYLS